MSTYAVHATTVAAQGCASGSVADELGAVRVGAALVLVGQALPGGVAGAQAAAVGTALDARLRATTQLLAALGGAMTTAAHDYEACESSVTGAMVGER